MTYNICIFDMVGSLDRSSAVGRFWVDLPKTQTLSVTPPTFPPHLPTTRQQILLISFWKLIDQTANLKLRRNQGFWDVRNCPIFKQYLILCLLHHFHHTRFIFGAVCGQFLTRTCFSRPRRTHFRSGGSRFYSTAVAVCSNYWCWLLTTSNCASIHSILPNCATSHSTFLFSILYFQRRLRPLSLQF